MGNRDRKSKREVRMVASKGISLIVCALFLVMGISACGTNEEANSFNSLSAEIEQLHSRLSSKITEAETTLAGAKPEELAAPAVLDQLKSQIDAAKKLSVDIPAMASDKSAIAQQVDDLTTLLDQLQKQYDSLSSAVSAIAASKQKLAEQKAESLVGAGIIAVSANYPYDATEGQTITLTSIDPKTGTTKVVRKFSSVGKIFELDGMAGMSYLVRQNFDSKYRRVAAKKIFEKDGSTHVGWADESGTFFDVTNAVSSGPQSEFTGATMHSLGRFGPDDYFYYLDHTIQRVPSSNPSKDNVEAMNVGVSQGTYYIQPNGLPERYPYYAMSDTSGENYAYTYSCFCDWIDRTTFISESNNGMLLIEKATPAGSVRNQDSQNLIPRIEGRENWNGIVSPDGSQVAFLSYLTTGSEPPGLFIVPSSGGEPVKVPTSYTFSKGGSLQLLVWK